MGEKYVKFCFKPKNGKVVKALAKSIKIQEVIINEVMAGAVATGAGQYTLQAGIGGAIAGGINYYFEHPMPTYFFVIY
ncbi:hypothetical protein TKV_c07550 [Thermoanaerobacter kivui]|uniref:Uncharacterized protein n=1 Tax=Thermoanaerobacter kivui TaxID=2325 RepID=A0A097AQ53_THEKI|nr:hypothetical protein [Thermoanaerobacter kivui]AIS51938.1 hypothetical protein TKV_c07550 [Thermoanaerobacter kivui]